MTRPKVILTSAARSESTTENTYIVCEEYLTRVRRMGPKN